MQNSEPGLVLTIEDVGYGGRGVARDSGRVIFVPGVLAGETVRAAIVRAHRSYADACLVGVVSPSPDRVEPACPLALRAAADPSCPAVACPGCVYQHAAYATEVDAKQGQLETLLARLAGVTEMPSGAPFASPDPLGYRNRITLHAGRAPEGPVLGYVGSDNRSVLDVARCPLAVAPINEALARWRADDGALESLAPGTDVTWRHTAADGARQWVGRPARGQDWLTEATAIGALAVPPGAFFQVNPAVADALLEVVAAHVAQSPAHHLVEFYCGVGVFSLAAALRGKRVRGLDTNLAAVRAARQNARALQLERARFDVGPAEQLAPAVLSRQSRDDTLLLVDPPRQGLDRRVVKAILAAPPRELMYISCAADTLARDIARLQAGGYTLTHCRVFDMFPRTAYFETLALLEH